MEGFRGLKHIMTILENIFGVLGFLLIVGFFGGLIYICLFKAEASNMPIAVRGLGIVMLSGALKIIFMLLSVNPGWLDVVLIIMAVIGMLIMMTGLGKGPDF